MMYTFCIPCQVLHDCEIAAEFPLEGRATSLCWETLSQRIVVAVNGPKSDRLCFCDAGEMSATGC